MADKNGELSTICQENDVSQTSVTCTNHNDKNIFQETVELHQKKLKTKKRKLEPSKEKSQLDDSKGIGKVKDACVLVNDAEENDETSDRSTTVIDGGMINFPISPMHTHLICRLCNGYFRDPYTIPECLHTFCKSCLFLGFQQGIHHCPECKTSLSPDPYKEVLSDRTMQELVNKIFPSLKKNNDIEENIFYSKLGIKMKKEYREESANMSKSTRNAKIHINSNSIPEVITQDDIIEFKLSPDTSGPCSISDPKKADIEDIWKTQSCTTQKIFENEAQFKCKSDCC